MKRGIEFGGGFNPRENSGIREHHTVKRPDLHDMTYGGLHETRADAEQARAVITEDHWKAIYRRGFLPEYKKDVAPWENAPIVELKEGEAYTPWATEIRSYVHGVNDGTHDAPLANERDQRLLHEMPVIRTGGYREK